MKYDHQFQSLYSLELRVIQKVIFFERHFLSFLKVWKRSSRVEKWTNNLLLELGESTGITVLYIDVLNHHLEAVKQRYIRKTKYQGKAGFDALSNTKAMLIGNPVLELDVFPPYKGKDIAKNLSIFE